MDEMRDDIIKEKTFMDEMRDDIIAELKEDIRIDLHEKLLKADLLDFEDKANELVLRLVCGDFGI